MLNGNKRTTDKRTQNRKSGLYDPVARITRNILSKKREREIVAYARRELIED